MTINEIKRANQINIYLIKPLKNIEKRLNRLDVQNCNGEISEDDYIKRSIYLEDKANQILASFEANDLMIYHQSDPRGCSLYIIDSTMDKTNYTNGVAVC